MEEAGLALGEATGWPRGQDSPRHFLPQLACLSAAASTNMELLVRQIREISGHRSEEVARDYAEKHAQLARRSTLAEQLLLHGRRSPEARPSGEPVAMRGSRKFPLRRAAAIPWAGRSGFGNTSSSPPRATSPRRSPIEKTKEDERKAYQRCSYVRHGERWAPPVI